MALQVLNFRLLLILALVVANAVVVASQQEPPKAVRAVTIQPFSDFQCPFCAQFAPAVRELQKRGVEGVSTPFQLKQLVQYEERRMQAMSEITDSLMSRDPRTLP